MLIKASDIHANIVWAALGQQDLDDTEDTQAELVVALKGKGLVPDGKGGLIPGSWLNIEPLDCDTYELKNGEITIPKMPGFPRRWQWKEFVVWDLDKSQATNLKGYLKALKGKKHAQGPMQGEKMLTLQDAPYYVELVAELNAVIAGAKVDLEAGAKAKKKTEPKEPSKS